MELGTFGWEPLIAVGSLVATGISGFVVLIWRMSKDRTTIGSQISELTDAVKSLQSSHQDMDDDTDALKQWRSGIDARMVVLEQQAAEQAGKRQEIHSRISEGFRETHARIDSVLIENTAAHTEVAGRLGNLEGKIDTLMRGPTP